MRILEDILEYIFLPKCGVCNKVGDGYLCEKCRNEIEKYMIIEKNYKNQLINTERIFIENDKKKKYLGLRNDIEKMHILLYKDMVRKLILKYKFNDKSYLYKTFSELIIKNKKSFDFIKSYDIIIPVPIHKKRMRERGYNQSELIANELAKKVGVKIYTDVLEKIKNNKVQSTLSVEEREINSKNVYKVNNYRKIYNKKILIFDDIYTTGSTIGSCINELEKVNFKKIGILTLAKD